MISQFQSAIRPIVEGLIGPQKMLGKMDVSTALDMMGTGASVSLETRAVLFRGIARSFAQKGSLEQNGFWRSLEDFFGHGDRIVSIHAARRTEKKLGRFTICCGSDLNDATKRANLYYSAAGSIGELYGAVNEIAALRTPNYFVNELGPHLCSLVDSDGFTHLEALLNSMLALGDGGHDMGLVAQAVLMAESYDLRRSSVSSLLALANVLRSKPVYEAFSEDLGLAYYMDKVVETGGRLINLLDSIEREDASQGLKEIFSEHGKIVLDISALVPWVLDRDVVNEQDEEFLGRLGKASLLNIVGAFLSFAAYIQEDLNRFYLEEALRAHELAKESFPIGFFLTDYFIDDNYFARGDIRDLEMLALRVIAVRGYMPACELMLLSAKVYGANSIDTAKLEEIENLKNILLMCGNKASNVKKSKIHFVIGSYYQMRAMAEASILFTRARDEFGIMPPVDFTDMMNFFSITGKFGKHFKESIKRLRGEALAHFKIAEELNPKLREALKEPKEGVRADSVFWNSVLMERANRARRLGLKGNRGDYAMIPLVGSSSDEKYHPPLDLSALVVNRGEKDIN